MATDYKSGGPPDDGRPEDKEKARNVAPPGEGERNPYVRYEHRTANVFGILISVLLMIFVAVLIHFTVTGLFHAFDQHYKVRDVNPNPMQVSGPQRLPPEPRLQPGPVWSADQGGYVPGTDDIGDLHKLRQEEDNILQTYGWVDQYAGVVRIPVSRALALAAQNGVPEFAQTPSSAAQAKQTGKGTGK